MKFQHCSMPSSKVRLCIKLYNVKMPKMTKGHNSRSFVCVEVLRPSQPNGVMSSAVSLPNHTFTGQA